MPHLLPETGKAPCGAGDRKLTQCQAEEQVALESRGEPCIAHQRRQLRPMALAVEERMQGYFAPRNSSRLWRHPVQVESVGLVPTLIRSFQQASKNCTRLQVKFEQSVQWTGGKILSGCDRQTREPLVPAQFHAPDVAHKLLNILSSTNTAGQLKQMRVSIKVGLPELRYRQRMAEAAQMRSGYACTWNRPRRFLAIATYFSA